MNIHFAGTELAALIVATSFAAGLNVYATLATMGILSHAGVLALPGSLHLIESWWVVGACLALFAVEFFADKVPAFDRITVPAYVVASYSNTLHTAGTFRAWRRIASEQKWLCIHDGLTAFPQGAPA